MLAFTNLTLGQLRSAIELFTSFIDEETYALFYYNGHAVGYNEDIYLATVESSLGQYWIIGSSSIQSRPLNFQILNTT